MGKLIHTAQGLDAVDANHWFAYLLSRTERAHRLELF